MATDDVEILVYLVSYQSELACQEEYARFAEWLEYADIDKWVFCGRGETHDENGSIWFNAVCDAAGGRTFNEFTWAGELYDLDEELTLDILDAAKPGLPDVRYGGNIGPVRRPDGTWAVPRTES